jgi:hypothetical protein
VYDQKEVAKQWEEVKKRCPLVAIGYLQLQTAVLQITSIYMEAQQLQTEHL